MNDNMINKEVREFGWGLKVIGGIIHYYRKPAPEEERISRLVSICGASCSIDYSGVIIANDEEYNWRHCRRCSHILETRGRSH